MFYLRFKTICSCKRNRVEHNSLLGLILIFKCLLIPCKLAEFICYKSHSSTFDVLFETKQLILWQTKHTRSKVLLSTNNPRSIFNIPPSHALITTNPFVIPISLIRQSADLVIKANWSITSAKVMKNSPKQKRACDLTVLQYKIKEFKLIFMFHASNVSMFRT